MSAIKCRGKILPSTHYKPMKPGDWVFGWYVLEKDGSHRIIEYANWRSHTFSLYTVDPMTLGLQSPVEDASGVDLFEGDIVTINDGFRGVVKFGKHFLGEENGLEFSAYGFYVEFKNLLSETIQYSIVEHGVKYEKIGNVHDNPEIKLTVEDEE